MFQSGFLDKRSTLDAAKAAAPLPSTGADAQSANMKKLQEAFGHQPDVKLESPGSKVADEDAGQADVSRMLGMPPPLPPHGESLEADSDLVVRPSTRLQSSGQAGQMLNSITLKLQDKPPAEQASDTRLVPGVPQAQPPPETGEQRAATELANLANFRKWRQRPQSWKRFQADRAAPDSAASDWGALAAEHGSRLMQLAQEAGSSVTGPEQASAGLESQTDTAGSSRRHEVNLQASGLYDSDSDEFADPEGSFSTGLPGAMGGLLRQLHASESAPRSKLRSISGQQAQHDLSDSNSNEVGEVPPITDDKRRFLFREQSLPSSFDSAASNVDSGADPSAPSSVTGDSVDRFLHGCRPPSLPSVPSSPRDSAEPSTAVSAFQLAEGPLQSESDEEVDGNGERIVRLDPWGRTVKEDAFGWWKRKHGKRLVTVPVSLQRQKVQELRHGEPRPPPATPDEIEVEKLRRLGNKLNREGKHKEALGAYLQAHLLQPRNARLLAGLAAIYVHLGKWNAAEKSATQAEEIDPNELNLYWWRHLARSKQGNLQLALEDLAQILRRPRNYQQRGHFYHAFAVLRNDEALKGFRRREEEAARLKRGDPAFAQGIAPLERELREAERKSPAFLKRHQQALRDHGSAEWEPSNSLGFATMEDSAETGVDRYIKSLDHLGSSVLL